MLDDQSSDQGVASIWDCLYICDSTNTGLSYTSWDSKGHIFYSCLFTWSVFDDDDVIKSGLIVWNDCMVANIDFERKC
jgi:hypothetical protein